MSTLTSTRVAFDKELKFIRVHISETPYWEYVTRTNSAEGVTIVAVTERQEIVLVKQHRIPIGAQVIELPAGLVGEKDHGEEPKEAVVKGLHQETGYLVKPENICLLAKGPALAGLTNEVNGLYLATDATRVDSGGGVKAEGESIETLVLPLDKVTDELQRLEREGNIVDLKVYAGLHFLTNAQRR